MEEELPEYHRKPEKDYFGQQRYVKTRELHEEDDDDSLDLPHQSNPKLAIVTDQYTPLLLSHSDVMIRGRKRRLCICGSIAGAIILLVLIILICVLPRGQDAGNPH